jgi:hypothetical protein
MFIPTHIQLLPYYYRIVDLLLASILRVEVFIASETIHLSTMNGTYPARGPLLLNKALCYWAIVDLFRIHDLG